MNCNRDFIMEPVDFLDSTNFMNGSEIDGVDCIVIYDKELAQELFFDQCLSERYKVWADYIDDITCEIYNTNRFEEAKIYVDENIKIDGDYRKKMIRRRRVYLELKRKGERHYIDIIDFLDSVEDECVIILKWVSLQRYLFGFLADSPMEKIFNIFKLGLFPCGFDKLCNVNVAYNPIDFRAVYQIYRKNNLL
mgnify:CR=1 FL=1